MTGTIKNNARIEAWRLKGIFFVKAMGKRNNVCRYDIKRSSIFRAEFINIKKLKRRSKIRQKILCTKIDT